MAKVVSQMVWSFRTWRKSFPKWFGVSAHGESYFPNGLELVVAKIWKLTVQRNGHVRLLGHYYSVPHTYVGKKVTVFYTSQHVEIYQYYRLIAQHTRNYQGFGFTTIKEHLPAAYRLYLEEDPTPYLKRAKEIDPVVEDFLQIVIERKRPLLAACKSCKGILSFENKVGKDRHRKKSTIIASQIPVRAWYEAIADQTVADAIMDRIIHGAIKIQLKGESMRKRKNI